MFENRQTAGAELCDHIEGLEVDPDHVLALSTDGAPVGRQIADSLDVPMDLIIAENVPAPGDTDLAVGAVTPDGSCWRNDDLIERRDLREAYVERELDRARQRARERTDQYDTVDPGDVDGQTALLVDAGIETGSTAIACLRSIRRADADHACLAVPVAPEPALNRLRSELECDRAIALETPRTADSVASYYDSFRSLTPDDVQKFL